MPILEGKTIVVTGVLTESSIAFHVARLAQEEGAKVILTSFGRTAKITKAISRRLPEEAPVIELDASNPEDFAAFAERVGEHADRIDGVVHSIGFAPKAAFDFMGAEWEDVAPAMQISAFSLKALAKAAEPMMQPGGSIVGLTLDEMRAIPTRVVLVSGALKVAPLRAAVAGGLVSVLVTDRATAEALLAE